jgi:hypothetical protein
MHDNVVAAFGGKTGPEVLEALAAQIYRPPLSALRDRLGELPAAARVPILIIDLDTEMHMQGIVGFLGNSSGHHLDDTIEALTAIGAQTTAATMRKIAAILARHGIMPGNQVPEACSIWLPSAEGGDTIRSEIKREAQRLYLYLPPPERENVFGMLEPFIEENRDGLLQVVRNCSETASK